MAKPKKQAPKKAARTSRVPEKALVASKKSPDGVTQVTRPGALVSPKELAKEIAAAHGRTIDAVLACGKLLLRARDEYNNLTDVINELPFSRGLAYQYLHCAEWFADREDVVARLGPTVCAALVADEEFRGNEQMLKATIAIASSPDVALTVNKAKNLRMAAKTLAKAPEPMRKEFLKLAGKPSADGPIKAMELSVLSTFPPEDQAEALTKWKSKGKQQKGADIAKVVPAEPPDDEQAAAADGGAPVGFLPRPSQKEFVAMIHDMREQWTAVVAAAGQMEQAAADLVQELQDAGVGSRLAHEVYRKAAAIDGFLKGMQESINRHAMGYAKAEPGEFLLQDAEATA